MAWVAGAGPASNLLLSVMAACLLAILVRVPIEHRILDTMQLFTAVSIRVNLALAFFNLLPLPPLDGFMVLQGFLRANVVARLYRLAPVANVLLLVLLVSGGLSLLSIPIAWCYHSLIQMALAGVA
jgi:Zn-dependent protease